MAGTRLAKETTPMNAAERLQLAWFQAAAFFGWRVNPGGSRGTKARPRRGRGRGMVGWRIRKRKYIELHPASPLFNLRHPQGV